MSEAANKYREHVKKVVRSRHVELSVFPAEDQSLIYGVELVCYMNKLENPNWFERFTKDSFYTKDSKDGKHKKGELKSKKGDRKATRRYKQVDVDNRVKFVQDCVIKGLGIPDDSQVFEGTQRKIQVTECERVTVRVYVADREKFFPARR